MINNLDDRPSLLRNIGEYGNWLLVALQGSGPNPKGVGARVVLEAGELRQVDEVRSGGKLPLP